MQDILSFVQTQSPVIVTPSSVDSTKISNADNSFSESFFSLILGELTEETQPTLLDVSSQETLTTTLTTQPIEVKETDEAKSIDEHLLEDLLSVVNALKMDNQTTNFPTIKASSNLEKILASETTRQEFANVQNMSDLVDLSKKYNLGLEKMSISKESIESLQSKFQNLTNTNFFQDLKTAIQTAPTPSELSSAQTKTELPQTSTVTLMSLLEKPVQKSETTSSSSILSELISKEIEPIEQTPVAQLKTASSTKTLEETTSILPTTLDTEPEIVNEKQQETTTKVTQSVHTETTKKTITAIETVTQKVITPTDTKKTETTKVVETIVDDKTQDDTLSLKEAIREITETASNTDDTNETSKVTKSTKEIKESDESLNEDLLQTQKVKTEENYDNTTSDTTNNDLQTNTDIRTSSTKQDAPKQSMTVKETLNQFSTDLKEKIDAYKAPIMKVELSLSPKSLGDVDVTLLTRGNNLHVNISSNSNTMALFTQNQSEVKNALINMGFSNLEMNFSDQRNNDQSQQNNQKQRSGNFDTFSTEQTEEDTTLLEVVIPQYV